MCERLDDLGSRRADETARGRIGSYIDICQKASALLTRQQEELERLRGVLETIKGGNVPKEHASIYRADGVLSKNDACPHSKFIYDDCENCIDDFISAALQAKP